jgi:glycosyltransferase involved in cell wall biosynthesis
MIETEKLFGIVIWYYPTLENVGKIKSYIDVVQQLIIIDNSDVDNSGLLLDFDRSKIIYIPNFDNNGMATALNQGCKLAIDKGAEWVLTMDQDSCFFENNLPDFIQKSNEYTEIEKVAIFCPVHFDSRNRKQKPVFENQYAVINYTMTSGNLLSLNHLKVIGFFQDDLFIDWVDEDICIRISILQLQIVQINSIFLEHFVGNGSGKINFFGVSKHFDDYAPIRFYYITRNVLRLCKKYPSQANRLKKRWKRLVRKTVMYDNKHKLLKIKFILIGLYDYFTGKTGSIEGKKPKVSEIIESPFPEVSIALCTYNGERFLPEQLESIINQDYKNITEVICIDDNSSDGTWKILTEYADKYHFIKIVQNTSNLGFIKNFEKALSLCTKPFIAIADQDDVWYPTKITKLVNTIGTNFMAYSDNEYIDLNGNSLGRKFSDIRNLTTCKNCLNFALMNVISGHTILMNSELLKYALPFNTEIPHDHWLAFHASQYGEIPVVKEALVGYRQHENNTLGAIGGNVGGKKDSEQERINESHKRIQIFAKSITPFLSNEKRILEFLAKSYTDKSVIMRFKRVSVFWKNKDSLLLFKKRTKMRNMLYCIKVFWKYQ